MTFWKTLGVVIALFASRKLVVRFEEWLSVK
jgi:hypothetical protein